MEAGSPPPLEAALKKLKRRACGPCASAKRPCDLQDNDRHPGAPSTCSRCRQIGKADLCIVLPDKRTKQYASHARRGFHATDGASHGGEEEHVLVGERQEVAAEDARGAASQAGRTGRRGSESASLRSGGSAGAALRAVARSAWLQAPSLAVPAHASRGTVTGRASGALHRALGPSDSAQHTLLRELLSSDARLDPADEELLHRRMRGAPVSLAPPLADSSSGSSEGGGGGGGRGTSKRTYAQAMGTEEPQRDCRLAHLSGLLMSDARLDPSDEEVLQRITGAPVSLALASASEAHGSFTPSGASGRSFAQAMATEQHERDCRTQEIASKSPHPTLLVSFDGGGCVKGGFANDPWLSIFGLTAESVHASLASGFIPRRVHPLDVGLHEACTMTTLAQQQPYQQHVARFQVRDDTYVSAQETLQVHYGSNGWPLRMNLLYTMLGAGGGGGGGGEAHSRLHSGAGSFPPHGGR